MIKRCPCRKCLVEPVCKDPCEDFSKFASPLAAMMDKVGELFETIDNILDGSVFSRPYNWIGEYVALPVSFFLFRTLFAIKTDMEETTLFDERLSNWVGEREENE